MSNSRSINDLASALARAVDAKSIFRSQVWGAPQSMTEALRDVQRSFSSADMDAPKRDVLVGALDAFRKSKKVENFTELKYVCYGVSVPVGREAWRLIDQRVLFEELLQILERFKGQPKQFRRCFQGLLNGYFTFDKHAENPSSNGFENWQRLRGYLGSEFPLVVREAERKGLQVPWVQTLKENVNLLSEEPCGRYAKSLLSNNFAVLQGVCSGLGIPSDSWVWSEALFAYVKELISTKDEPFRAGMPRALDMLNRKTELVLPPALETRASAMIVIRYSQCNDKPEHAELRDTTMRCIGNPWLERTAWDAHVKHEPARIMIESWLKRRLIRDFFELLAQDGAADLRRLNYWLKWEPHISDMWFVLGADARGNGSKPFMDVRKRMAGRDRFLSDPNPQNNAFVMRIGTLLVIEFGLTGNACYAFKSDHFLADLDQRILDTKTHLKQKQNAHRLLHTGSWEFNFDEAIRRLDRAPLIPTSKGPGLGTNEAMMPTRSRKITLPDVREVCRRSGLEVDDHRHKGGALWVNLTEASQNPEVARYLETNGFKFRAGRGYWIEDLD